jgi:hypothetical protein
VAQDQIFTSRLEQLLQGRLQRPVRVINSGVGRYNTVQEVTYFEREGITFQPDLPRNYVEIGRETLVLSIDKSYLLTMPYPIN